MSGTSVDAIDGALVRCNQNKIEIVATREHAIPATIKAEIASLSHSGANEIERLGILDRELGQLFAEATLQLLASTNTRASQVRAIGSHGQTVRHRPPSAATGNVPGFSLQIGDPNTIAERTGIITIADFRRRDIAAGGEGAPLAPAFHAVAFAKPGANRAIVNIGGISNATFLEGTDLVLGFDTGPGNTLMDHWILAHLGESFDRNGQWAAAGQVNQALLAQLLAHTYFEKTGPRSTGKEAFNLDWLSKQLTGLNNIAAVDVQATLMEFTATSITRALESAPVDITEIYICGGGSHNTHLMQRLAEQLAPATLQSTAALGIDPDWVEAATFAWLASRTLGNLAGNSPVVTGAAGDRVLGGIYAGSGLED